MVAVSLVPLTFLCRYRSDLLSPVTQEKHGGNTLCFLTPSLGWLPTQHNIINKTGRISIPLVLQGEQWLFSCQAHILLISWQVNPKDEKGWSALLLQKQLIKAWIITMIWCTDSQRDETDLAETWQYLCLGQWSQWKDSPAAINNGFCEPRWHFGTLQIHITANCFPLTLN